MSLPNPWPAVIISLSLLPSCNVSPRHEAQEPPAIVVTPAKPVPLVTEPPGAPAYTPELRDRLAEAIQARYPEATPRTRHLHDNGRPIYSNRLLFSSSPYLQQHAHNPVGWFPWGPEAFELAKSLNRPIFLSVGYATCHWCHVMEEESFEDLEIAELINTRFIPVKVDREQRPDVDEIYMTAVQQLTGRGGWPMTVVMTPDRLPFFGATYIPPRTGVRGSRRGLDAILTELADTYRDDRESALREAQRISNRVQRSLQPARSGELPDASVIEKAATALLERYDDTFGGIGGAPKFPQPSRYLFLLRHALRHPDAASLEVVTHTLTAMAHGGMYDQLGGGFHRYSVDRRWLVPHFEKMLYDNAQLAELYTEAALLTRNPLFERIARQTLDYIAREMTHPQGGFYSATDADSEGEEGVFFVWTPAEIQDLLSDEDASLVLAHYGVTKDGNFDGHNILHVAQPLARIASTQGVTEERLRARLDDARNTLYRARAERIPPLLDDKILTAWNGLMLTAMARASLAFDEPRYRELALANATFLREHLWKDGRLLRTWRQGQAELTAYLDDYAFLIRGLLDLFELTGDPTWLRWAKTLQAALDEHHLDPDHGGYFFTADDAETLLAREKPWDDGALPSGNAIAAENLLRLYELTGDDTYQSRARELFKAFSSPLSRYPSALPRLLIALDFDLARVREIVLVDPPGEAGAQPFLDVLRARYLPHRVLIPTEEGEPLDALVQEVPLVKAKIARQGKTTAYVCYQGQCELPTTDPEVFSEQLK